MSDRHKIRPLGTRSKPSILNVFYIILIVVLLITLIAIVSVLALHTQSQKQIILDKDTLTTVDHPVVRKSKKSDSHRAIAKKVADYRYDANGCLWNAPEIDYGPHIVFPPDGPFDLVCCNTTKGIVNIAVHKNWAPIGAENFLNMVKSGFFSSEVGLFRALQGFLVQFGLAGDPSVQEAFEQSMGGSKGFLVDDPPWLPLGPPGREIAGVKRFQRGYMAASPLFLNYRSKFVFCF